MKKLVVVGGTAVGVTAVALLSAGIATSQPDSSNLLNVVGEPYAKAVAILKSQGVHTGFGGSFGSAMPQAQCPVSSEKMLTNGKVLLMLDCTEEAKQALLAASAGSAGVPGAPAGVPGPPTVGSNGVTTVTPTPVGPQPGMDVG